MAEEKPQESDLDVMSQLSERMKGVGKEAKSLNLKLSSESDPLSHTERRI